MQIVDFRSDTNTLPTDEMRQAMALADVANDGYNEDPTANRLEALSAEMLGKEDAIFVPSGTMGNLLATLTHCGRGDGVIIGDKSHMFRSEYGGIAALGGIVPLTVRNDERGMMDPDEIDAAARGWSPLHPPVTMVSVENTHNHCGGSVLNPEDMSAIADVARRHEAQIHVDGARIFNAAVYLEAPAAELAKEADSVTFCLSKGLGAPIGSVLCGSEEFIDSSRRWRRMLGGGMRQVGVIAAAGIVALETMVDRLAQDHANARKLALGLSQIPGIAVNPDDVATNLVFFEVPAESAGELAKLLGDKGIKGGRAIQNWRFCLYNDITEDDVDHALNVIDKTFREYALA